MTTQFRAHPRFMRMAISEALRGKTAPNPRVGAVVVRNGKTIASGFHRRAGQPHAEIEAMRALESASLARGATLYVTLEPCSTEGRTPPCTQAIIAAGFSRVVYGATDPNPSHAGAAKKILENAGIAVVTGVLEEECAALNSAWNKWISTGLPFVTVKAGMSLDGRISSPPDRRWITCQDSRADAMHLRATHDAILVGGETVRADNPRLTLRGVPGHQPLRVVWTRSGELPADAHIFTDRHPTRIFRKVSLRQCLKALAGDGIQSVLIEGGGRVHGEAFDRQLVDRAVVYVAPILLGGPTPAVGGRGVGDPKRAPVLDPVEYTPIGADLKISGTVRYPAVK